jgi:hypothetical protein
MVEPGCTFEDWLHASFGGTAPIQHTDDWPQYMAGVATACPRLQFVQRADGGIAGPVLETGRHLWTRLKEHAADNPARLATWDAAAREFFEACSVEARPRAQAPAPAQPEARAAALRTCASRARRARAAEPEGWDATTLTVALMCAWVLREVDKHHEITRGHHQVFLATCSEPLVDAVQFICGLAAQQSTRAPQSLLGACAAAAPRRGKKIGT